MLKRSLFVAAALGLLAAIAAVGYAKGVKTVSAPKEAPKKAGKKRILVVTWTTGFRHSSIPVAEQTLGMIGEKSGLFKVDYCRTQDDVTKMLTPEYLKDFDGVFFANTTGNLHIPDLHAFLDWIKAGHAFMGAHSASDTYHPRDVGGDTSYVDMLGGEFKTHGNQAPFDGIVDDPKHPAGAPVAPEYRIPQEEIYEFLTNDRDKVHVILSLNHHPMDGHPNQGEPGDYLIAWCKMYGKGRVFYTALGHREDVWQSEPYQQHLLGGIRWALGLAKGDSTPGNRTIEIKTTSKTQNR